jgi:NTP pyrophosphatase (non-canonical NTP hydrolase)
MELQDYREQSARTCPDLTGKPVEDHLYNNVHMLMGMTTEVGELMDAYKRHFAYGKPLDGANVAEEIGDLMWYVQNFCRLNGIDLGKVLDTNIAKLQARFPDRFDAERALHRDLVQERQILEREEARFPC